MLVLVIQGSLWAKNSDLGLSIFSMNGSGMGAVSLELDRVSLSAGFGIDAVSQSSNVVNYGIFGDFPINANRSVLVSVGVFGISGDSFNGATLTIMGGLQQAYSNLIFSERLGLLSLKSFPDSTGASVLSDLVVSVTYLVSE